MYSLLYDLYLQIWTWLFCKPPKRCQTCTPFVRQRCAVHRTQKMVNEPAPFTRLLICWTAYFALCLLAVLGLSRITFNDGIATGFYITVHDESLPRHGRCAGGPAERDRASGNSTSCSGRARKTTEAYGSVDDKVWHCASDASAIFCAGASAHGTSEKQWWLLPW